MQDYVRMENMMTVFFKFPVAEMTRQCHGVNEIPPKSLQPSKSHYPVFECHPSQNDLSAQDLVWLEAAMPAIGEFVAEGARLGGGGPNPGATPPENVMSSKSVFQALLPRVGSLSAEYPCVQNILTSAGEVHVTVHVHATATSASQATAQYQPPTQDTEGVAAVDEVQPPTCRMCFVCRRTQSDLLSRSSTGLMICSSCRSPHVRYCSAHCQKLDWKRHKVSCRKAAPKTES